MDGIAERSSETIELNFHEVSITEAYAFTETQQTGAEIMHVHVSGTAVDVELEMVMFDVGEAVAHLRFARANRF